MINQEVAEYLIRLKNIYVSINGKVLAKDITKIEKLINLIQDNYVESAPKTRTKKFFKDQYKSLLEKDYSAMTGTKINYELFDSQDDVVNYVDKNAKNKIFREATALDLKLLYSLLTADPTEIKGTKNDVYDAIKRNVRARRRGEAFMKDL